MSGDELKVQDSKTRDPNSFGTYIARRMSDHDIRCSKLDNRQ
jgi:hypothetical protein